MEHKKTISSLFDEHTEGYLMSLEEFTNTPYDDLIEGETIIPDEKESRKMERNDRDRNIINWLLKPYKSTDEKQFKKLGKRFITEKKYKDGFHNRYMKDKEEFKKTRYFHFLKYSKQKGTI